ncbi:ParA family protein [Candidatus Saccharibacteria bacterium]|nr:MAG: ParA family protein [Candidatus Saccharibacteria bacterium]
MAYIVAITNQKGGVGKTTTAINLAAQLATNERRVVLVDLDPQGNSTSSLGIDKNTLANSLYDVLLGRVDTADIVKTTKTHNLFVLPASPSLAQAEVQLVDVQNRETRLKEVMKNVDAEVVVIDCPPALGLLTINALTAAHSVIIPVQAEYFALEGLSQLMQTMQLVRRSLNPGLHIFGVVLTMFTKRTVLSEQVKQEVEKHFGDKVFHSVIPRNIRLAEAPSYGKTIFEHDRWSKGARAYKALAQEVVKRGNL